jgi:hypothetical protein
MKQPIYYALFFCYLLFIYSCKKEAHPHIPTPDYQTVIDHEAFKTNFGETVIRDFIGIIVNQQHQPLSNVTIRIGNLETQTDEHGIFSIKHAQVNSYFSYITAYKAGYILGSRALAPIDGTNEVKIMLVPELVTQTINSGTPSSVSLHGTTISFDGQFKTNNGNPYQGPVKVIVNQLNTEDNDFTDKMPGMLFARNDNGEARVLESYGMINVELQGGAGEKLQPTNPAQIAFPIAASQLAQAPNTIPLWHFNDTLGYWIEEGSATKVGNTYVGNFAHFSWWNFDIPYELIMLKLRLVDQNGNALSGVKALLSSGGVINTNSNGQAGGLVPKNTSFTLSVYANNDCNTLLGTHSIGPFSSDITLPDLVINTASNPNATLKSVFGQLKNCNETNVTNGYVVLKQGAKSQVAYVTDGDFEFNIVDCSSAVVTLFGQNLATGENSGIRYILVNNSSLDLGYLTTCQEEAEGISITFEETSETRVVHSNLSAIINGNTIQVTGGTSDSFSLTGNNISLGTHTTSSGFTLSGDVLTLAGHGGGASILSNFNITYHIIQIGAVGEYIDIAFTGTLDEDVQDSFDEVTQTPISYSFNKTISGMIHIKRTL